MQNCENISALFAESRNAHYQAFQSWRKYVFFMDFLYLWRSSPGTGGNGSKLWTWPNEVQYSWMLRPSKNWEYTVIMHVTVIDDHITWRLVVSVVLTRSQRLLFGLRRMYGSPRMNCSSSSLHIVSCSAPVSMLRLHHGLIDSRLLRGLASGLIHFTMFLWEYAFGFLISQ